MGDPFLFTKDHFAFEPGVRSRVEAELSRIEGAQKAEASDVDGKVSISRFQPWAA